MAGRRWKVQRALLIATPTLAGVFMTGKLISGSSHTRIDDLEVDKFRLIPYVLLHW